VSRPAGYVFGYASLADPEDPLVRRTVGGSAARFGSVPGRRRWTAGMSNREPVNDHKHYVDPDTRERPDVVVVTLSLDPGTDEVQGVAIPVTHDELRHFDRRELRYDRVALEGFRGAELDAPLWTYTAHAKARADLAAALRDGRAVLSDEYVRRVRRAFARRGDAVLAAYLASTDEPALPRRRLEHLHLGVERGG
jgi:hypothetical protein